MIETLPEVKKDTLREDLEFQMRAILKDAEPHKSRVDALKIVAEYVVKTRADSGDTGRMGSGFDD